jgi:hypothetical protein
MAQYDSNLPAPAPPSTTLTGGNSISSLSGMQPDSALSETTPTEFDFWVPEYTEEFCACNVSQAQRKIAHIQDKVEAEAKGHTHTLLISGLTKAQIQQLLQKRHGGVRVTFTEEQVLLEIMPAKAYEELIVFVQHHIVKAMDAANCPMSRTTWMGTGATALKGRHCAKEPAWGMRPIVGAGGTSATTKPPRSRTTLAIPRCRSWVFQKSYIAAERCTLVVEKLGWCYEIYSPVQNSRHRQLFGRR